ncbi:hypothetical protein GQ44DRAFT_832853 [Phaeosphaeriaceae sp. PMI808]|nr:hypothetical protein GQ44DRAFT_832853 [Phaeosphaeriaceae sp. PMI808]
MSSMPSFRGGYAPRRGRGGWSKPFVKPNREYTKPDIEKQPLGQLLRTIDKVNLKGNPAQPFGDTPISELRYVASYNWRNDNSTTILVPGKPPRWTPLHIAQRLNEDNGQYYRDPSTARYPEFPMAPIVQAVLDTEPSFPTELVDIVACGSTLGNLLRFVRGQDKAFRFAVETIGNTVFFLRKENDPKEIIEGVRGYGHTFPEAYTTWEKDVKGSETHQRIIQYKFGGHTCLIRFESDGYIKDNETPDKSRAGSSSLSVEGDDLLSALHKTVITQPAISKSSVSNGLKIEHGGCEISQDAIFDLKTRSGRRKIEIDMSDVYPLLWIKQIPNFIIAYHDGAGLFQDIRVQEVRKDIQKWEEDNMDAIRRLAELLDEIVAFARKDSGLLEVYSSGAHNLEIHRQYGQGKRTLPDDLMDTWAKDANFELALSDSDHGGYTLNGDSDEDEPDYTACTSEDCGYCGKCTY